MSLSLGNRPVRMNFHLVNLFIYYVLGSGGYLNGGVRMEIHPDKRESEKGCEDPSWQD